MSRKTIRFKMPEKEPPRRDDTPDHAAAPLDEPSPIVSRRETRANEVVGVSEPDRWVQNRDLTTTLALEPVALASPAFPPNAKPSLMIDLAGERSLAEILALSFLAPPILCWFWGANAITRTWGNLGVNWRAQIWIAASERQGTP